MSHGDDDRDRTARRRATVDELLRGRLERRRRQGGDGDGDSAAGDGVIPRRRDRGPAPLSFAQERLWFLDRLQPQSAFYNIPMVLELAGDLDADRLNRALLALARRQESLRTRIETREDDDRVRPVQVVEGAADLPRADWRRLPRVDLSALPRPAADGELARLARDDARRPFDLAAAPLCRYVLVRLGPRHHDLLTNHHHAIYDGWSGGVFLRELAGLYAALGEGGDGAAVLPELPVQYADFAVWQRGFLQGDELERQLSYWRRRLDGAPELLELPTDRPRPALQSYRGGQVPLRWSAELSSAVERRARELSASPFMLLLAAWKVLLARLSGQWDVVVGTPVANRRRMELEHLVGFFANTLALRTDLGGDGGAEPSFRDVVGRVRDHVLDDFSHQDLPFEELVAELKVERNLSHAPVFQVMFTLQNTPARPPEVPGLALRRLAAHSATAKFTVSLGLTRGGEGFHGGAEYNRDLFDRTTVARWLAHLETLLEAALAAPETAVGELPLLTAAERRAIVAGWNDTGRRYDAPELLHVLVERQVDATPDAPALRFRDERLTYGELDERANRLARFLADRGVGPEVRVGVAMERGVELVLALHAVVKAGGAYVPVDPDYPAERVRFMLADALGGGGLLLTREELRGELESSLPAGVELLAVDGLEAELAALPAARPAVSVDPENPAYAIYTSGSTGRPKGAVNRHRSIVNRLLWMQETFRIGPGDRVLQKTPFSFDVSVWELFWPLLAGAELVVAEPGGHQNPAYLVRTVRELGVTTMHFVPSMLHVFLGEPGVEACGAALERVICSGEALPPDLVRRFHERLGGGDGGARLFNLYGPTEAAVDVTWTPCDDPDPRRVTLGRPVANTRMHAADRRFRPQPVGVAGELLIGGVQLARGYLGRPALTAERFVPDPFAAELEDGDGGGRVYRTGDLGRYLPDGEIEYLGRLDHQVKVRGLRIELGEVETSLAAHPAVRETVVMARGDGADTRLVAFLVAAEQPAPAPAALREHLRRHLPEHMVPTSFVVLDEMPLSPNGKADRKALAALDPGRPGAPAPDAAAPPPGGSLERRLAALWSRVLGHEEFGADDNFFDVGGHSLLVIQVQRDLRRALGVEVEVVDLFRFPTLRSLADQLRREGAAEDEAVPVAATAVPASAGSGKVAVVGMAGRFPGAADLDAFWRNLRDGVESVRRYSLDEMRSFGVPEEQLRHPDYVPVGAELEGADLFDADYFGYAPREAQIIDPQQRLFLEVAVAALEDAGLDPGRYGGRVGVYGGAAENRHVFRIAADRVLLRAVGAYQVLLANRADYLPTRTAYKLGLTGPAVNVQTACSTSLVAVHVACRALLDGDCDAALAGGSSVGGLTPAGYVWEKGGIASPDGHTRAFDAEGRGTSRGHGVGVVVLKRVEDALADGDPIRAVIAGTAVTNDGKGKVGFTAPSVDGQARAVADAQRRAGVDGGEIDYVEAHGTATELGDPIEVAALRRVFAGAELPPGRVALGSVKSNLGHLDAAAGVTGLIKTVLALEHATLPASLHFRTPNPKLDLPSSPFRVVAETEPWRAADGRPRRAGVSSFGVGGTNAHAVVEEAPPQPERDEAAAAPAAVCLPLSARTPAALAAARVRLAGWFEARPELTPAELADAAWTLQHGRRELEHRTAVVAPDREGAVAALRGEPGESHGPLARRWQGEAGGRPEIAFLLSGQGSQHPGMARGLYDALPAFRETFERCREGLAPHLEVDLAELVFADGDGAAARLERTAHAQPALFAVEVALAAAWHACGVQPAALLGHSLGEYTAACLAGVFELEAALELVAERGRLMQAMEPGSMLAVARPETEVVELLALGDGVELAAVNGPDACVVAGPTPALEAWRAEIEGRGVEVRPLHTSHAFHTAAMEPALEPFRRAVEKAGPRPPRLPLLSNLTGGWMSADEATAPDTWVRHLRSPVRFGDGAAALLDDPDRLLLEVGPGRALATLVRRRPEAAGRGVLTSLPHPRDGGAPGAALGHLLTAAGRLWIAGAGIDWAPLAGEGRRKLHLPTYPFQRQSYWVDDPRPGATPSDGTAVPPPEVREPASADTGAGTSTAGDDATAGGLEELLVTVWRDLLGRDEISRHDDFFELGGSSLLAVRLASRLRDRLRVDLDPHDLLEHPTVARLAAHLAAARPDLAGAAGEGGGRKAGAGRAASPDPLLVCMQPRGDGAPLFLVHPAGGHNLTYRYVVRELGDGRPVWAFRARGLEEGEEVLEQVEDLATRYLDGLRKVRPDGPYHLCGSSFGGTVAWEMARRLSEDGATVGSLVLVDAFGPGQMPPRGLVQLPEEGFDTELFGGARREELPDLRRIRAVMAAAMEAMYAYDPPPWDGRATFFRASVRSHRDEPAHPERAWVERALGGLEVHVLPGGHTSMLRPPHAEVLAARLADVVARSEKSSSACPVSRRAAHSTK